MINNYLYLTTLGFSPVKTSSMGEKQVILNPRKQGKSEALYKTLETASATVWNVLKKEIKHR